MISDISLDGLAQTGTKMLYVILSQWKKAFLSNFRGTKLEVRGLNKLSTVLKYIAN